MVLLQKAEEKILGEGLGDIREVNKIRCRRNRCRCRYMKIGFGAS